MSLALELAIQDYKLKREYILRSGFSSWRRSVSQGLRLGFTDRRRLGRPGRAGDLTVEKTRIMDNRHFTNTLMTAALIAASYHRHDRRD